MVLGQLEIQLLADVAKLRQDMEQAKKVVGDAMAGVQQYVDLAKKAFIAFAGIATVGAFVGMIKGAIDGAAAMKDLAAQASVSVAALGAFKGAAAGSDTSTEAIVGALGKMSKSLATADEDSKGAALAIKALGLDIDDVRRMQPDAMMLAVAKAMSQFKDGADKSAAAQALFGKEGAKLLPFLADLGEEADQVTAKLTDQAVALKGNQAAMSDAFGDNLAKVKKEGEAWKKDLAMGMVPALYELSQAWVDVSTGPGGLKEAISKLAKDGTLTEWTRVAVTDVTYVSDAVQIAARVLLMWREQITAFGARLVVELGAMGQAAKQAMSGDFSGALASWNQGVAMSARIAGDSRKTIEDMWSEDTLGQKLRARMAELKGVDVAAQDTRKSLNLKAVLDAQAAADDAAKKAPKEAAEEQRRHKAELEAAAKAGFDLKAAIKLKNAGLQQEVDLGRQLTPVEQELLKLEAALASGKASLSEADAAAAREAIEHGAALERQVDWAKQATKENLAHIDAVDKRIEQLEQETKKQLEDNEAIGLAADAVELLKAARLRDAAATADWLAAQREAAGFKPDLIQQQRDLAQALRDRADAMEAGAIKQRDAKAAQDAAAEWRKVFDQVGQSLSDALMGGGRSAGQQLVRYFETLAVRMAVQAVIVNPLKGALGLTDTVDSAASGAGATGGGSGMLGTASNAVSLYRTGAGLAGTVGSGISTVGSWLGSGSMSAYGAGMGMTAAQAAEASSMYWGASTAASTVAEAAAYEAAATSITAGSSMGASLAALGPYAAAAAALYAIAKSMDDSGTPHTGGGAWSNGTLSALDAGQRVGIDLTRAGDVSAAGQQYALQSAQAIAALLNGVGGGGFDVSTAFADDSSNDGAWGGLVIGRNGRRLVDWQGGRSGFTAPRVFSDGEAGQREYLAALAASTRDALNQVGLPEWATKMLDSLGDAPTLQQLASVADQIKHTEQVLAELGKVFSRFNGLSGDAVSGLTDLFGGIDALSSSVSAYMQAIYSDADKLAVAQGQVGAVFAQLGQAVPESAAQFQALVEAQDLNTASGREMYAALVRVSPVYAQMRKQLDDQAAAARQLRDAWAAVGDTVEAEIKRLRGLVSADTPRGYAALQADFAVKTGQARAGDQAAFGQLVALSQSLSEYEQATAGSRLELARLEAARAASLAATMQELQGLGVKVPAYADGGLHSGGWAVVGDGGGPELVNLGPSRVYSNADSRALLDTSAIELVMARVERRLEQIQADARTHASTLARHARRAADVLEDAVATADAAINVKTTPAA